MLKNTNSFDFILGTVSAEHDINAYLNLLKRDGTLTLVGAPEKPLPVLAFNVIHNRRSFAGSGIGGIRQTQEMLDFCGEHEVVCDVEKIRIQQINDAYDRPLRRDVKYRFVIDMAGCALNVPLYKDPTSDLDNILCELRLFAREMEDCCTRFSFIKVRPFLSKMILVL